MVVASWTGRHADALRQALRMTNESFAEHLWVAVRTVAYWRKRPEIKPQPAIQETLDAALARPPDRIKEQFFLLVDGQESVKAERSDDRSTTSLWLPGNTSSPGRIMPDDVERIEAIERQPSRLDPHAIDSLGQVLAGQRHLEDTIGPVAVMGPAEAQLNVITEMLRGARGPHRNALASIVAEWTSFVGWLHTAIRDDTRAMELFKQAEELADEAGNGTVAATATSFAGYIARLQGRPRKVIRATAAALATPGAHPTQRTYDLLQTAQGYADLGDKTEARRFLDKAADLAAVAGEPPPQVYWYTEPFFRLHIGLTQLAIGNYREAMENLKSGIKDLPADQRNAEWVKEYRQALAYASEQA